MVASENPVATVNSAVAAPELSLVHITAFQGSGSVLGVQKCPPTSAAVAHVVPVWIWTPPVLFGSKPCNVMDR